MLPIQHRGRNHSREGERDSPQETGGVTRKGKRRMDDTGNPNQGKKMSMKCLQN